MPAGRGGRPMRAVAYIRVSDSSQVEGHSLDAQERLFHELCKNRGWLPGRTYREEGKSAHSDSIAKRPMFRQLLEDAGKGQFEVLVARTLGSFGEFFSDTLATHVKKGISERARQGLHLGGIPFGYQPCWEKIKGERQLKCHPEHPGGLHIHPEEGPAVAQLFKRYAFGTTTLSQLASWLNDQGFRTRNMHKLPDPEGNLVAAPRLFTVASVRGILHNPFYLGKVKHQEQLLPGAHEALISEGLFQTVQMALKKNSGRSETLKLHPQGEYLLK